MKASTIFSTLFFSAAALAAPAPVAQFNPAALFTFKLTNEVSGASAASSIAINAAPIALKNVFPWATNLLKDGKLTATSAENINPAVQNVFCIFKNPAGNVIKINDQITFAQLDGVEGKAVETDVSDFTIECQQ